ncbi:MAG: hypothetical protein ACYCS7_06070 [Acidimicrobiales bacterium]
MWSGIGAASAATSVGPSKTAWYDRSGAQQVTGETTPSSTQPGELEVSYAPAAATVPPQTLPSGPGVPGAPVAPPSGVVGGNTIGNTLAFAALEYTVPLQAGGQTVDPASIQALLTLTLDPTSSGNVSTGDLIACPTATTLWSAGGDQDYSQAPQYSCGSGQAVTGNVDSATHTVTFDLASIQENSLSPGTFSLVIVPGASPSGAFQAVITPPSSKSLTVTNESPLNDLNTNLSSGSTLSPTTPAPQTSTPANTSGGYSGLQPLTSGSSAGTGTGTGTGTAPASASGSLSTPSGQRTFAAGTPAALRGGLGSGAQHTIALLVLLALGALLVMASSKPARAPRSLRAMLVAGDAPLS